jgi:hypothetical protein
VKRLLNSSDFALTRRIESAIVVFGSRLARSSVAVSGDLLESRPLL